jgi:hypothetical protein
VTNQQTSPKYLDIEVQLTGEDGNAMVIIGSVRRALRRNGVEGAEVSAFTDEAMSGDYDNALQTCMRWVEVA